MKGFIGYERPDGKVGARNYVAILPSIACANGVVAAIARQVPEAVPLYHGHGCGRGAARDLELHFRSLAGLGMNPNVGAVLVVGLGCEVIKGPILAAVIAETGKPVESFEIQSEGGSRRAAEKGAVLARGLLEKIRGIERSEVSPGRGRGDPPGAQGRTARARRGRGHHQVRRVHRRRRRENTARRLDPHPQHQTRMT